MKRAVMVLAAMLVAGSAMADGGAIYTSGGRTDDGTGAMGSGCCPAATQSSGGGYFGSGLAASQDDGGLVGSGVGRDGGGAMGSGTRTQKVTQKFNTKREIRFLWFRIAVTD